MVLLVNPKARQKRTNMSPLGLYCIAANLKNKGYIVKIIDLTNSHTYDDLITELLNNNIILAGVTTCTPNFYDTIQIVRDIKKFSPQTKTVLGGPHASIQYEQILKMHLEVDYVAVGAGERSMVELIEYLTKNNSFSNVHNIATRDYCNKIIINSARDIDQDLPFPTHGHFYQNGKVKMAPVVSTRGCPHNCSFCNSAFSSTDKWVCRPLDSVINEIKRLVEVHKINTVFFTDSNFLASPQRARALIEQLLPLNIKYWIASRADSLLNFENNLNMMFESGCSLIELGLESGSPSQLKRYNKGITLQENKNAIKLLKKYQKLWKFKFNISFIFFDYEMCIDELCDNIRFFIDNQIDTIENEHALFSSLSYLPGSELYFKAISNGDIFESYEVPFSYFKDIQIANIYAFACAYQYLILPKINHIRQKLPVLYTTFEKEDQLKEIVKKTSMLNRISYNYMIDLSNTYGDREKCCLVFGNYKSQVETLDNICKKYSQKD